MMILMYLNRNMYGPIIVVYNIGYPRAADVVAYSNTYSVDWSEVSNVADMIDLGD